MLHVRHVRGVRLVLARVWRRNPGGRVLRHALCLRNYVRVLPVYSRGEIMGAYTRWFAVHIQGDSEERFFSWGQDATLSSDYSIVVLSNNQ